MNYNDVARICHEANRAYCATIGDLSQVEWDSAPDWQRDSAVAGVEFHLANPDASPAASHGNWLIGKLDDGWTYGEIKDPGAKKHPCLLPFDELPVEQRAKDHLFRGVVHAIAEFVTG